MDSDRYRLADFGRAEPHFPVHGGDVLDDPIHTAADWNIGRSNGPFGSLRDRQNLFLAEPQASMHLNVMSWLRIGGGAGYRLIGRGGDFTERLRGLTANIGVQIGPR